MSQQIRIPKPMLVVDKHEIFTPKFLAIDAHNHLGRSFGGDWFKRHPAELLPVLDESGVQSVVNLDGGFADDFYYELEKWSVLGDRVLVFTGVAWSRLASSHDLGERAAAELERAVAAGARGLKIWKDFGLQVRDGSGTLLPVDTPRLDALWAKAGELNVPVLIHVGDPVAFFEPIDDSNERLDELRRAPEWSFSGPEYPRLDALMRALEKMISRHPATTFIGAHVGCYAENLAYVGGMLDRLPNYYVDLGARVGELGRQPNTARRFFLRYADRILFGTDAPPNPRCYQVYYRFLETTDDNFPYWPAGDQPWQGRWFIHGLGLPDTVLQRVYYRNAHRVLNLTTAARAEQKLARGS
jgi:predicted TIM-barrel fold metal-dependent hydrolase